VRGTLELGQEAEEFIVDAPVAVRDNHTGDAMGTVKLVMEGLGQLVLH
jgi:hypothetical protein